MIIDSRYHAVSLVAVFLALGIGIVIGGVLFGEHLVDKVVAEQDAIINLLEEDYKELKNDVLANSNEKEMLLQLNEEYFNFVKNNLTSLIGNKLLNKKIGIYINDQQELPGAFVDCLLTAGANIVYIDDIVMEKTALNSNWSSDYDFILVYEADMIEFIETQSIPYVYLDLESIKAKMGNRDLAVLPRYINLIGDITDKMAGLELEKVNE